MKVHTVFKTISEVSDEKVSLKINETLEQIQTDYPNAVITDIKMQQKQDGTRGLKSIIILIVYEDQ